MLSDFPSEIVNCVAHRPWPMPDEPWIMTQSWHDLLFAHWPVDKQLLRERIPPGLELELFDNHAWLGIVPFRMSNVAPRGVPALPWLSAFPELNVRTYVRVDGKPGVYFFSLDAGNRLAVMTARRMFHLPYYFASIGVRREDGWVHYQSARSARNDGGAIWKGRYRAVGPAQETVPGSLEYFLTERYCLYTVDDVFRLYCLDIHHPPWRLQIADATIEANTMADAAGLKLPALAPLVHMAPRQDVVAWRPKRVTKTSA